MKEQKHDTIDWAETLKVWNCRQLYVLREQIGTLAEDLLKKRQEQKHDTFDWAGNPESVELSSIIRPA